MTRAASIASARAGAALAALSPFAAADSYTSTGPAVPISHAQVAVQSLVVADALAITDVDLTLRIAHPRVGELRLTLRAPDGTSVVVLDQSGGEGDDFFHTTLDDEASGSFAGATAPFQASFPPSNALSAFDGHGAQGTWTLEVVDLQVGNDGSFVAFSLGFNGLTVVYEGPALPMPGFFGMASATVQVVQPFTVADVDASFELSHPLIDMMAAFVSGPAGKSPMLWNYLSGHGNQPIVCATFDDDATVPLTSSAPPPFNGRWRTPTGTELGLFSGTAGLGTWGLVAEYHEFDTGGILHGGWLHFTSSDTCLGVPAESASYGTGTAGTLGVPSLALSGPPAIGSSFAIQVGNSAGIPVPGYVLVGNAPASVPIFGGTLLVSAPQLLPVSVPSTGLSVPVTLGASTTQCGQRVYLQAAELDFGAPALVSMSPGLELVIGS